MYGTGIKIIGAQKAKIYKNYKDTGIKLLITNAAIWFNKIRKFKKMTPK